MAAVIFNGENVKALKNNLIFKSDTRVMTGDTDDPTSVAKSADIGSIYIRSGTREIYVKTDNGSTTNWDRFDTSVATVVFDVSSVSADPAPAVNGATYLVDTSGGAVTITLPTPSADAFVRIKDSAFNANTNNITVARSGSEEIEGVAGNYTMDSDGESAAFVSDGTDWFRL